MLSEKIAKIIDTIPHSLLVRAVMRVGREQMHSHIMQNHKGHGSTNIDGWNYQMRFGDGNDWAQVICFYSPIEPIRTHSAAEWVPQLAKILDRSPDKVGKQLLLEAEQVTQQVWLEGEGLDA